MLMIVLAQGTTSAPGEWAYPITAIINMGFAALVSWYLLSKGIPKMQEFFNVALAAQQSKFSEDLKSQREAFITVLHAEKVHSLELTKIAVAKDSKILEDIRDDQKKATMVLEKLEGSQEDSRVILAQIRDNTARK